MKDGFRQPPSACEPLSAEQADLAAPMDVRDDLLYAVPRLGPALPDTPGTGRAVWCRTLFHIPLVLPTQPHNRA
ncbi:hypothetical protein GCM10010349_75560 [Streptomyces flavofungini]|nr:hypothetical protein GCM10010349_75560 [Streptomyces flavofungini]